MGNWNTKSKEKFIDKLFNVNFICTDNDRDHSLDCIGSFLKQ